jgi:hypothetical protein
VFVIDYGNYACSDLSLKTNTSVSEEMGLSEQTSLGLNVRYIVWSGSVNCADNMHGTSL